MEAMEAMEDTVGSAAALSLRKHAVPERPLETPRKDDEQEEAQSQHKMYSVRRAWTKRCHAGPNISQIARGEFKAPRRPPRPQYARVSGKFSSKYSGRGEE
ncbi:hypothetical protein THAOC_37317 [Thalassiosira oceanica]|uniref:Uncharacterized protein n=1 Tax=Thalassiosira oceanica TaxID=159749 RepID=K0RCF2_THAOC|nr:hypothetical protein THAOC_37317 [Thalassiosira oceanica]|eukprot:EJK44167.1 hypothetical protein THAOC_37317 [Thalassiosira oceanica]